MPEQTTSSATSLLVEEFLHAKMINGLSVRTIVLYRRRLGRFVRWLGDRPITRPTVRGYVAHLHHQKLAPITIVGHVRDLSSFCSWLVEESELDANPTRKLAPKVPRRRPASYSVNHVQALLNVCDVRDRAIVVCLCDTGLRASELVSLQRNSIDWGTGHFSVIGKGNKERNGWFSDRALEAIRAYLETRVDRDPALWYGRAGPLTTSGVHQAIKRRAIQAGIRAEVRRLLHSFRATFAKNYLKRGGDLESLRELLGHTTIAMSAHYAQLADDELAQKKAAINPLAAVLPESEIK